MKNNFGKQFYIGYKDTTGVKAPDFKIKEAETPDELEQIAKLYMDTYGETDFLEEKTWYDALKMKNLIAADKNKLLATATWEKQADRLFLLGILTVPEFFRRGIATALLNRIKEVAGELKLPKIFVPLSNDDLVSYVFYHKNGFKLAGIDIGLPEKRHGKEEVGFWELPCRDELYFEYKL
jgi:GNAT superfamily N-acetyltransferase